MSVNNDHGVSRDNAEPCQVRFYIGSVAGLATRGDQEIEGFGASPENVSGKMCLHSNRPGAAATARGATQEGALPMSDQRNAAREALAAHDELRAVRVVEPVSDDDGMPLDPSAWLKWHNDLNRPAYDRWHAAMDALDAALGYEVGRHPFTFRPICEAILSDE